MEHKIAEAAQIIDPAFDQVSVNEWMVPKIW